jgi:hypothetical protein
MRHLRLPCLHRALVIALVVAATAVVVPVAPARLPPEAVSSERNPPFVTVTGARDRTPAACRVHR